MNEPEQRYAGTALADPGERTELKDFELRPPANHVVPVAAAPAVNGEEPATPLFSPGEAKEFRGRWDTIQGGFVDEPRRAVEQGDRLVSEAMKRLAEAFADERTKLEGQWDRKETVSTEDLRLLLRRYRSFFGRLLAV